MRAVQGPGNGFPALKSSSYLCISPNRAPGALFGRGPAPQISSQVCSRRRGHVVSRNAVPQSSNNDNIQEWTQRAIATMGKGLASIGICSALLLSPLSVEAREIRFPASGDPDVFTVQKTLVEAWSIVRDSFVDGDGGSQWESLLGDSLKSAYDSSNGTDAYSKIQQMLLKTGDPYTRIIPPEEYADFRVSSDGELQGVGLLIALDPASGRLMVLSPIKGGPADRAGILAGDELLSIDGHSTEGLNGHEAAKVLRGQNGTSVSVKFARRTEQVPGVPGTPEELPKTNTKLVRLKREYVELSPVFYSKVNEAGEDLGYIKLTNFSNNAAADMQKAIVNLSDQGVQGFILDLRGNPGGLVNAGLDIARLWMDGSPTVFNVFGRGDEEMKSIGLPEGHSSTDLPLVVVVNQDSASASEILAGALQDNHRATVVGDRTYGKGKIQSVYELDDGSALFVTVARYKTPSNHDIDLVGVKPDMACRPNIVGPAPAGEGDGVRGPRSLEGKTPVEADLEMDDCFLTAERFLYKNSHNT